MVLPPGRLFRKHETHGMIPFYGHPFPDAGL